MIWVCKSQRGVTLIELLVVIAIMMSLITLVAPYGVNLVEKAGAQTELIRLNGALKKAAHRAFVTASPVVVRLNGQQMLLESNASPLTRLQFERLHFGEAQTIVFNRNGFPGQASLTYQRTGADRWQQLDLAYLTTLQRAMPQ